MMVVMLDLSAAFDTVDYGTLNNILSKDFGMKEPVRKWILSYLSDREQFVNFEGENSKTNKLECGLPQGSCLGPVGWLLYASKLFDITKSHKPDVSTYADDSKLALCFSSKLNINDDKTELMLIGSRQMLSKYNSESIQVGTDTAKVVTNVHDLGLWVDSNLTFNIHVNNCVTKAHKQLYWINQIK